MNRQEKAHVIESLKNDFKNAKASFIITTKGLTVEETHNLRRQLYAKQGKIKVAKNTLLIRATENEPGLSELVPYFKDQIAVVFAHEEAPAIAKVLSSAAKEIERIKFTAGALDAKLISTAQIEFLASLPSREVMLARLAGTLQAPIAQYVRLLNQLIVRLLWALKEIEKKKQS